MGGVARCTAVIVAWIGTLCTVRVAAREVRINEEAAYLASPAASLDRVATHQLGSVLGAARCYVEASLLGKRALNP